jgi:S1-C subfamily serine protease
MIRRLALKICLSKKKQLQPTSHNQGRRPAPLCVIGLVMLLVSGFPWGVQGREQIESPGFDQDCSGFDQDPLLSDLWQRRSDAEKPFASLATMVPRLSLQGTALATYAKQQAQPASSTLEALFGVSQYGQREIVETSFYQEARAVVLYPNVLATVAHALTLDSVEVQVKPYASVHTVPLNVTSMTVVAHTSSADQDVPLRVAHINEPYDLSLLQPDQDGVLQSFPYPAVLSYGTGSPRQPIGGIRAGDCVAAVVIERDAEARRLRADRLVVGKVLTSVPVAVNSLMQTKLNLNMITTDLPVKPGDSGSPVLALRTGKPVLVGLVSATMYPTATFTYVSRIDPLLALADALHVADTPPQKQTLAQSAEQSRPEEK